MPGFKTLAAFTAAALLLVAPTIARAQAQCPALALNSVQGDDGTLYITLATKQLPLGLSFNWALSDGEILRGQGTADITVKAAKGSFIIATLVVSGLDAGCEDSVSLPIEVG